MIRAALALSGLLLAAAHPAVADEDGILVVGDSISAGICSTPGDTECVGWAEQLESYFDIRNEGRPGYSSQDWSPRYRWASRPNLNADFDPEEVIDGRERRVIIALGGNDVFGIGESDLALGGEPNTEIAYSLAIDDIVRVVRRAKRRHHVYLLGTIENPRWLRVFRDRVRTYNAYLEYKASRSKQLTYIPLELSEADFVGRGVHPLQSGYDKIAATVLEALR